MKRHTNDNLLPKGQPQHKRTHKYVLTTTLLILFFIPFMKLQSESIIPAGEISVYTSPADNTASLPDAVKTDDIYPQSLLEFKEKYPEAEQFVLDYPQYKDKHEEIDISDEVTEGVLPLFIQWDKRWGYETYGNNFLAVNGCGPTCISMIKCGLSGDTCWNPYEVAKMADKEGYYVDGVGTSWDLMETGARSLGLEVSSVSLDEDSIINTLESGKPIIASMLPGDFTYTGHFIILAEINEDQSIKVLDPNSPKNSEKSWTLDVLLPQIKKMWAYSV